MRHSPSTLSPSAEHVDVQAESLVSRILSGMRHLYRAQYSHRSPTFVRHRSLRMEQLEERSMFAGIEWGDMPDDLPAGVIAEIIPSPVKVTHGIAHSSNGLLATASNDGMIRMYDESSGSLIRTLDGHTGKVVTAVDFSPDGSMMASVSHDRSLRLWNTYDGSLLRTVSLQYGASFVEFSPDGKTIALSVDYFPCLLYDIASGTMRQIESGALAGMIGFSGDGSQIVYSHSAGVSVADTHTLKEVRQFGGFLQYTTAAAFDPTRPFVAGGGNDGRLGIWNVETGEQIFFERPHTGKPEKAGGIWTLAYSPDGQYLLSGDFEGTIIVWDVHDIDRGRYPTQVATYQNGGTVYGLSPTVESDAFFYASTATPTRGAVRVIPLPQKAQAAQESVQPDAIQYLEDDSLAAAIAAHFEYSEDELLYPSSILRIASTEGPNVLFTVSSQFDQSYVTFEQAGLLGAQTVRHEGGTHVEFGRVTFDISLPSGTYVLQQYDKKGGRLLDTVELKWDGDNRSFHLTDQQDGYGQDFIGPLSPQQLEDFHRVNSITHASLDQVQMNEAMAKGFVEMTQKFDKSHDFWVTSEEFMEYVYAKRPDWHPDQWQESIDAIWAEMDHQYHTRGDADHAFHGERTDTLHRWNDAFEKYFQGVTEILQFAVDALVRIQHGQEPVSATDRLHIVLEKWTNPQGQRVLKYYSEPVQIMRAVLGLPFPTFETAIETARLILEKHWDVLIRHHEAMANYREYADRQRENGLRETAAGEWVAISTGHQTPPETLTRREITLARKIKESLAASNHPVTRRINALAADRVALETADHLVEEADIETIAVAFAENIARLETDEEFAMEIGGMEIGIPLLNEASLSIQSITNAQILQEFLSQSPLTKSSAQTNINGFSIRTDSLIGQVFASFHSGITQTNDSTKHAALCAKLSRITGIEDRLIYAKVHLYSGATLTKTLLRIFEARGFSLESNDTSSATLERGLQARVAYMPEGIQLAFSPMADTAVDSYQINLVRVQPAVPDLLEIQSEMFVPNVEGSQFFANIPTHALHDLNSESAFKIIAWKDGRAIAWCITSRIDMEEIRHYLENNFRMDSLQPSEEQQRIESSIFKALNSHFPIRSQQNLVWEIGSPFHTGNAFTAADLNFSGDRRTPLYPIADNGKIESINDTYGNIVIRYEMEIDDKIVPVRSEYMHSDITIREGENGTKLYDLLGPKDEVLETIHVGKTVHTQDIVGTIGGRANGVNAYFGSHLHLLISYEFDGQKVGLDMQKFLANYAGESGTQAMEIYATDLGHHMHPGTTANLTPVRLPVQWDESLQSFVNKKANVLYGLDSLKKQTPDTSAYAYWLALEDGKLYEELEPVAWNHVLGCFVGMNNGKIWNSSSRLFE